MFEKFFNSPRNVYFRHNFVITFEIRRKKDFFLSGQKIFPASSPVFSSFHVSCSFPAVPVSHRIFYVRLFPVGPSFSPEETPSTPGAARRKIRSATAEPECDVPSRSRCDAGSPPFSTPHHRLPLRMPCGIRRSSLRDALLPSQRGDTSSLHTRPGMPPGLPSRRPSLRPSARQRRARRPSGRGGTRRGGAKGRGHQFFVRFKLTLVFTFTIFLLFARCNGTTMRRDRSSCATVRRKTFFIR